MKIAFFKNDFSHQMESKKTSGFSLRLGTTNNLERF